MKVRQDERRNEHTTYLFIGWACPIERAERRVVERHVRVDMRAEQPSSSPHRARARLVERAHDLLDVIEAEPIELIGSAGRGTTEAPLRRACRLVANMKAPKRNKLIAHHLMAGLAISADGQVSTVWKNAGPIEAWPPRVSL